ncbi:ferrochelatase [Sporolactobacillus terrae]|uniref:Coproporphyrin III ferrochelatase n=1 Tax=Sporolactobacillus terrae TaxID=269673 RepID=A0ABX5Q4D3_9BACL|nr:ferrochelatase [Sporolactobacillus terrae]QAA21511.1 ferrochelatase [Sporolactobacillus terrae]QAA24483.1 ferrochelatase [Sporolactobacillus terrae]
MEKTAVLLVNLGTPEAADTQSVRRYLAQFLSDPRVIDLPHWKWLPILHGIILRVRPRRSAKLYKLIWTEEGSPLILHARRQQAALQERLSETGIDVVLAMSYGRPGLGDILDQLHRQKVRRLLVLPLYPQYSSTTVGSVWDGVQRSLTGWRDVPELLFIRDYPVHPDYIAALVARVRHYVANHGKPDRLLLSYHGIPVRYAEAGDDYPERCRLTTEQLKRRLPDLAITQAFQSKFGREEWLTPATIDTVRQLGRQGVRHVAVIAPGFSADCLETLQELKQENARAFYEAGGQQFDYIPAVNDHPFFIDCLEDLVRQRLRMPVKIKSNC